MSVRAADKTWSVMYQKLVRYRERNGDCLVPAKYEKDPKLSHWVQTQRSAHKRNSLTEERVEALNSIDFVWSVNQALWDSMFQSLVEYKMEHGDCLVPQSFPQLGQWVDRQRTDKADNRLDPARKEQLDSIGFVWRVSVDTWDSMFQRLLAYKEENGNCLVPQRYEKDPKLGNWVDKQRYLKSNDRLQTHREVKLNSIGFNWSVTQESWDLMFQQLKEYKEQKGDCLVPLDYGDNPKLGRWVKEQRKKRTRILDHRKDKLDSIGFVWSVPQSKWDTMYKALLEYKRLNGNCLVPKRYSPNPKLGRWVHNQRLRRHVCQPDRRAKLDAIGFYISDGNVSPQEDGTPAEIPFERRNDDEDGYWRRHDHKEGDRKLLHHRECQEGDEKLQEDLSHYQQPVGILRYYQDGSSRLNASRHAPSTLSEMFPHEDGTVAPDEVTSAAARMPGMNLLCQQTMGMVPVHTNNLTHHASSFLLSGGLAQHMAMMPPYAVAMQPALLAFSTSASAASHATTVTNSSPYGLIMSEQRMNLLPLRRQELAATRLQHNIWEGSRFALMTDPVFHSNLLCSPSQNGTANNMMTQHPISPHFYRHQANASASGATSGRLSTTMTTTRTSPGGSAARKQNPCSTSEDATPTKPSTTRT